MKPTAVKCSHCSGRGTVTLSGVYAETLNGLRRLCKSYGYVVANRDAKLFGCKPTALNNRLAALERHGLARSEKFGRQRRFVAVQQLTQRKGR
jgi:hypothetical protein